MKFEEGARLRPTRTNPTAREAPSADPTAEEEAEKDIEDRARVGRRHRKAKRGLGSELERKRRKMGGDGGARRATRVVRETVVGF